MNTDRIFIFSSDIRKLTGFSQNHCTKLMRTIKDALGKNKPHQYLTIDDFCNYQMIDKKLVAEKLNL